MIYAYIRVSTDRQTTENQRFELLKFADQHALRIDEWIEETKKRNQNLHGSSTGSAYTPTQRRGHASGYRVESLGS